MVQRISIAIWEIDSSIEHEGESVDGQTIRGFMPGQSKSNIIKLTNNDESYIKFYIQVQTSGIEESNNLFLNENIQFNITPIGDLNNSILATNQWNDVQGGLGERVYFYEVELLPGSEFWLDITIEWSLGNGDYSYEDKGGRVKYQIKAKQVNDTEKEDIISSQVNFENDFKETEGQEGWQ